MKAIFAVSGEKKAGKTLFLQKLISLLKDNGFILKGFYALNDETTDSYHAINIQTDEKILLMTRTGEPDKKPAHFSINESAVKAVTGWMKPKEKDCTTILLMDEIGFFELNGMVWHDLFSKAVNSPNPLIFTTKTRLLPEIIEKWKIDPLVLFQPADFFEPGKAANQIIDTILHFERNSNSQEG